MQNPSPLIDAWSTFDAIVAIRRRWFVVVVAGVVGAAIGGAASYLVAPRYEARALLVQHTGPDIRVPPTDGFVPAAERVWLPQIDMDAYREVAVSPAVIEQVARQLGDPPGILAESFSASTEQRLGGDRGVVPVIWLVARGPTRTAASRRAGVWAEVLQSESRKLTAAELERQAESFDVQVGIVKTELDIAVSELTQLQAESQLETTKQRLALLRASYDQFQTQLSSFEVMQAIASQHFDAFAKPAAALRARADEMVTYLRGRMDAATRRNTALDEHLRALEATPGVHLFLQTSAAWNLAVANRLAASIEIASLADALQLLEQFTAAPPGPEEDRTAQTIVALLENAAKVEFPGTQSDRPPPSPAAYRTQRSQVKERIRETTQPGPADTLSILPPAFSSSWLENRPIPMLVFEVDALERISQSLRVRAGELLEEIIDLDQKTNVYTTRIDVAERFFFGVRNTFESLVARREQARTAARGDLSYGLLIASGASESAANVSIGARSLMLAGVAIGLLLSAAWIVLRARALPGRTA